MNKILLKNIAVIIALCAIQMHVEAQNVPYWKSVSINELREVLLKGRTKPEKFKLFQLDAVLFNQELTKVPNEKKVKSPNEGYAIDIPDANGNIRQFTMVETSCMEPALAAKYPGIKSYRGVNINNSQEIIRLNFSNNQADAFVFDGGMLKFCIKSVVGSNGKCMVYNPDVFSDEPKLECGADLLKNLNGIAKKLPSTTNQRGASDGNLHTYRLALACNYIYTSNCLDGTETSDAAKKAKAIAQMTILLNQANEIFERDVAIHFELIANNDELVEIQTASNAGNLTDFNQSKEELINYCQIKIDTKIGNGNYDAGFILIKMPPGIGMTSNSPFGCARFQSVCQNNTKGEGYVKETDNLSDARFLMLLIHEMGHKLGANHTFTNYFDYDIATESPTGAQLEPGRGSTIMGYSDLGGPYAYQPHNDFYYHAFNIQEITDYVRSSTCGWGTSFNAPPTIDAGGNYSIPKSTPFKLTAIGSSDDASEVLTYTWEQMDQRTASNLSFTMPEQNASSPGGPLFRSLPPSTNPSRSFPELQYVLSGANSYTWEVLPATEKQIHFRATVRDNQPGGGQTNDDDMIVNVAIIGGPFMLTFPNNGETLTGGYHVTITWDVANTDIHPISCNNVKITLSIDGGITFPVTLTNSTPNTGTFSALMPMVESSTCRIKIESIGNIFYDICDRNFSIRALRPSVWLKADTRVIHSSSTYSADDGTDHQPGGIFINAWGYVTNWRSETDTNTYQDFNSINSSQWYQVGSNPRIYGMVGPTFDPNGSYGGGFGNKPAVVFDWNAFSGIGFDQRLVSQQNPFSNSNGERTVLIVGKRTCFMPQFNLNYTDPNFHTNVLYSEMSNENIPNVGTFPVTHPDGSVTSEPYSYNEIHERRLHLGKNQNGSPVSATGRHRRDASPTTAPADLTYNQSWINPSVTSLSTHGYEETTQPFLATWKIGSGGSFQLEVNRRIEASGSLENVTDSKISSLSIGSDWGYGWGDTKKNWQGSIAEVIIFDRTLSQHDFDSIQNYLINKYDLPLTALPPDVPTITADKNNVCPRTTVTLHIASGQLHSANNWEWFKNDCHNNNNYQSIGFGETITVNPDTTTTYYAKASSGICYQGECSSGLRIEVIVPDTTAATQPTITASRDSVCIGESVTLSVGSGTLSNGATWHWYNNSCGVGPVGEGNSISVIPNPVNGNWGSSNYYWVRAEGAACTISQCAQVQINANRSYYYVVDNDGDGYYVGEILTTCSPVTPAGYVAYGYGSNIRGWGDCDDNNVNVYLLRSYYIDADGDGVGTGSLVQACTNEFYIFWGIAPTGYSTVNTDPNDNDASIRGMFTFYIDADHDGFGTNQQQLVGALNANTPPVGYSKNNLDCNDNDPYTYATGVDITGSTVITGSCGEKNIVITVNNPNQGNFIYGLISVEDTIFQSSGVFTNLPAWTYWKPFIKDNCGLRIFDGYALSVQPEQPGVTISVSPGTLVASGTIVHFTAVATQAGQPPVYQWFKNGQPISGATQNVYAEAITGQAVYSCRVTAFTSCTGITYPEANSNEITITVAGVICVPSVDYPGSSNCIGDVVFGTWDNALGSFDANNPRWETYNVNLDGCSFNGYGDFTHSPSFNVLQGQELDVQFWGIYYAYSKAAIFIDYNNDGDFEDTGENIIGNFDVTPPSSVNTPSGHFMIPANIAPGYYRMRIVLTEAWDDISPCHSFGGEIEDYLLRVMNCVPHINGDYTPWFTSTTIGDMTNTNPNSTNAYEDLTAVKIIHTNAGAEVPLSLITTNDVYWSGAVSIFADFNKDGFFNGPGEQLLSGIGVSYYYNPTTGIITIPDSIPAGDYTLRVVVSSFVNYNEESCNVGFGRIQDYGLSISSNNQYCTPEIWDTCSSSASLWNVELIGSADTLLYDNIDPCTGYADHSADTLVAVTNDWLRFDINQLYISWGAFASIYLDYNNDGIFNETPDEKIVVNKLMYDPVNNITFGLDSFLTASIPGIYRMRIVSGNENNWLPANACFTNIGDVFDITLKLAAPCSSAVSVSSDGKITSCKNRFIATAFNAGQDAMYEWLVNDSIVAIGSSAQISDLLLYTGDQVSCHLYPHSSCSPIHSFVVSNIITLNSFDGPCYCVPYVYPGARDLIQSVTINSTQNNAQMIPGTDNYFTAPEFNTHANSYTGFIVSMDSQDVNARFYNVHIWIDYNDNGSFADHGEAVYTQFRTGLINISGNFFVPDFLNGLSTVGVHRMRVVAGYLNTLPCDDMNGGGVKDYNIRILPGDICSGSFIDVTLVSSTYYVCSGDSAQLTALVNGYGFVYQWEKSADGVGGWTIITGATNRNYTKLNIATDLYFRCKVTCIFSRNFVYSDTVKITLGTTPVNDNICSAIDLATTNHICQNTTCAGSLNDPDGNQYTTSATNNTVWYKYTPGTNGRLVLNFEKVANDPYPMDIWVSFYKVSGTCDQFTFTNVENRFIANHRINLPANGTDSVVSPLLYPGFTYYVMIDGYSGSFGAYCLSTNSTTCSNTYAAMSVSTCQYFDYNGKHYMHSGIYVDTLVNSTGCDSIVTLTLSTGFPDTVRVNETICSSSLPYLFEGREYWASAQDTLLLHTDFGCDSLRILTLTVNQPTASSTNISVCANSLPYTWNEIIYSAAGSYTIHLINAAGCDSAATLHLSIKDITVDSITGPKTVCEYASTSYLTTSTNVATYSVNALNATGYVWTVPALAKIRSGQGTNTITVAYATTFAAGNISVTISNSCTAPVIKTFGVISTKPIVGAVSGPANACTFIGTGTPVTYSILPVTAATSYIWIMPSNVSVISGGTSTSTSVTFSFNANFASSGGIPTTDAQRTLHVKAVAACGTSADKAFKISVTLPPASASLTGPANACPYMTTDAATYTAKKVANATSYLWTVPTGATILDHPGGAGTPNDTIITVHFDAVNFAGTGADKISVAGVSACGTGLAKTLVVKRGTLANAGVFLANPLNTDPTKPVTDVCVQLMNGFDNSTGTPVEYKIRKVNGAISYIWNVTNTVGNSGIVSVTHPAGPGLNDTVITVLFDTSLPRTNTAVSVKAANPCYPSGSTAKVLLVKPVMSATPGTISGPADACTSIAQGTAYTYFIKKVPLATSYKWQIVGASASQAVITGHPGGAGTANDTVINVQFNTGYFSGGIAVQSERNCGRSVAKTLAVTVKKIPAPASLTGNTTPCPLTTETYTCSRVPNANGYLWTVPLNATFINLADTAIEVTYPATALFKTGKVSVTATSVCSGNGAKSIFIVKGTVCRPVFAKQSARSAKAIKFDKEETDFTMDIFPNPSSGNFTITVNSSDKINTTLVNIVNEYGQEVYKKLLPNNLKQIHITNIFSKGVYFVSCIQGTKKISKRIIILK